MEMINTHGETRIITTRKLAEDRNLWTYWVHDIKGVCYWKQNGFYDEDGAIKAAKHYVRICK